MTEQGIQDPNRPRKAQKVFEHDPQHIIAPPETQKIPANADETIKQKRVVMPEKTKPPRHPQ